MARNRELAFGRTRTGRLWVYARDDRPWGGPEPPAAVYFYSPDRKAERPAAHLESFQGVLQVDGYAGFETLAESEEVVLAACWAHARRKFYDFRQATDSPIAEEALRRIAELYAVEKAIRGQGAEARRLAREAESRPLIAAMKPWLEDQLRRVPPRGGLAEAIRYVLARWLALSRFLDDGRIELDNNPVERAIRPARARAQDPSLCRLRRRRRALGDDRLVDRDRQAQRRRALCLSQGCPAAHGRRPSHQPAR